MYLARLQPEQPVADGAHDLDRLRRRRRHRHDREHRALHRGRATRRSRRRSRARSRSASPSCRSRCRSSRCSSRCSSWAASSGGSSASSRSRSRVPIGVSALLSLTLTPMMCAHLLRPEPTRAERGALLPLLGARLRRDGRGLRPRAQGGCSRTSRTTLARRRSRTLGAHGRPRGRRPEGLLPAAGHRRSSSASPRRRRTSRSREMMDLQRARRRRRRCRIPTSQNVASFIGADGTNPTTNSGRLSITLKPRDERTASADEIIARLQPKLARGRRHRASTCRRCRTCRSTAASAARSTSTRSRTPIPTELADVGAEAARASSRRCPSSRDVASDQQTLGPPGVARRSTATPRRASASRRRPIDDTLYDAFGQRQVSTSSRSSTSTASSSR